MTGARIGKILLVLSLIGLPMTVQAQDPLTQTYTARNDALTFDYPSGWFVGQAGAEVFLSNSEAGLQAASPSQLQPGELVLDILVDPGLMTTFGILPASPPEPYYDILQLILTLDFGLTDPGIATPTTLNGYDAVRGEASGPAGDVFLIAFQMDQGLVGAAFAFAQQGDLAAHMPTIEAILATVAYAPPLALTAVTADGLMQFKYPIGWLVMSRDTMQAMVVNSNDVLSSVDYTPGMLRVILLSPTWFTTQYGLPADASVDEAVTAFIDFLAVRRPGSFEFGTPTPLGGGGGLMGAVGGDSSTLEWRSSNDQFDSVIWAKSASDYGTVALFATSGPGGIGQFEPVLQQMFDSVVIEAPAPAVINGSVVWQTQHEVAYSGEAAFGTLGGMTVTADDQIVIADGTNGLQIFSPDGEWLNSIKSPDILFAFDVAVDAQGNLWVTDSAAHKVVQLDPQGNTLQSFGEVGTGLGQFGENTDSPTLIEFGPDGNLFIYAKFLTGNNQETAGYVQIWSTDGQFRGEFSTQPPNLELFPSPVDMAFGPNGELFMVNAEGVIRVFTDTGEVRSQTDFRLITAANSLDVAPNGDIFIGALGGVIYHYSSDLQYIDQFGNPQPALPAFPSTDPYEAGDFTAPTSLGVLSNGDIVLTDTNYTYSQVVRITFAGGTTTPTGSGGGGLGGSGQ